MKEITKEYIAIMKQSKKLLPWNKTTNGNQVEVCKPHPGLYTVILTTMTVVWISDQLE